MFSLFCRSVLVCVSCMEHSDSESDFELQEAGSRLDGLADEPPDTSSEESVSGLLMETI